MTLAQRNRVLAALHSLKSDADHAWQILMAGDETGIKAVFDSYKNLEKLIIQLDTEK